MGYPPPSKLGQTHACENIISRQPSDAGGNDALSLMSMEPIFIDTKVVAKCERSSLSASEMHSPSNKGIWDKPGGNRNQKQDLISFLILEPCFGVK